MKHHALLRDLTPRGVIGVSVAVLSAAKPDGPRPYPYHGDGAATHSEA